MLATTSALGTVMLVLSFLSVTLGQSPIGATAGHVDEDMPFSTEAVQIPADQFNTMYSAIVVDIASFAGNPDLALATSRRDEMTAYAESLVGQFGSFAEAMQGKLDAATDES